MSKKKAKPKSSPDEEANKPSDSTTSTTTITTTPSESTDGPAAPSQVSDTVPAVSIHTSTDKPTSRPAPKANGNSTSVSQSAPTSGPPKETKDSSQKSKEQDQKSSKDSKEGTKTISSAKSPDATETKQASGENVQASSELPQEVSVSLRSAPPQASTVGSDQKAPETSAVDEVIAKLGAMRLQATEEKVRMRIPGPFGLVYEAYDTELQLPLMQRLIEKDLSEPYSIFTYRYFLNNWPELCFLAMKDDLCVGTIICKLGMDKKGLNRGYIAMLAVDSSLRKMGIGSTLVKLCIEQMKSKQCDVVVLETELTNLGALALYDKLDFVRDKRLMRYYLNGVDAFRLKLWLTPPTGFC